MRNRECSSDPLIGRNVSCGLGSRSSCSLRTIGRKITSGTRHKKTSARRAACQVVKCVKPGKIDDLRTRRSVRALDGPFLADTYTLSSDAAAIATYLIEQEGVFPFLNRARVAYVLQQPALMLHGELADAYITRATVQGPNRLLFAFLVSNFGTPAAREIQAEKYPLDFLIYIDASAWARRAWNQESGMSGYPIEREALIFHELSHLRQLETDEGEPRFHDDGRPMLALVRHTYECFSAELLRYGPQTLSLEQVGTDYVAGAATEKARRKRGRLKLA